MMDLTHSIVGRMYFSYRAIGATIVDYSGPIGHSDQWPDGSRKLSTVTAILLNLSPNCAWNIETSYDYTIVHFVHVITQPWCFVFKRDVNNSIKKSAGKFGRQGSIWGESNYFGRVLLRWAYQVILGVSSYFGSRSQSLSMSHSCNGRPQHGTPCRPGARPWLRIQLRSSRAHAQPVQTVTV